MACEHGHGRLTEYCPLCNHGEDYIPPASLGEAITEGLKTAGRDFMRIFVWRDYRGL